MSVEDLRPGAWKQAESPYAWMSVRDGELIRAILLRAAARAEGRLSVLEWGSGRSTLEFTRILTEQQDMPFRWVSLEYDRAFFDTRVVPYVLRRADSTVRLVDDGTVLHGPKGDGRARIEAVCWNRTRLRPFLPEHVKDRTVDLDAYVTYPYSMGDGGGQGYDIVIVDGRMRRRCLLTAAEHLGPRTVVLLHDAWHTHYQCALRGYPAAAFFGDELWAGAADRKALGEALGDAG